jgi:hypothetical protein
MIDCRINRSLGTVCSTILQFPGILSLIMKQPRVVITLVKVLEDRRQDLWLLFGQIDAFSIRLEELASAGCFEEGRLAEDVFVSGKETLLWTDTDGDDG